MTPTEKLIQKLETLPEEIQKQEFIVLGFSNAISTTESEKSEMEVNTMASIANELIDGKKVYPNDDARQGELNKRLSKRKDYNESKKNINQNKNDLERAKIKLKYL